jgi:hypothetical protein
MLPQPVRDEASQGSTASVRVAEREGIHADTVPQPVRSAGRVAEREGFMQTRCHGQSVTKLVRALQLQRKRRQGGRARRIPADTLPRPVRDEASQGSKLQRKRRQGGRAAQLDSGASRLDNNSRRGLMQRALEPGGNCLT